MSSDILYVLFFICIVITVGLWLGFLYKKQKQIKIAAIVFSCLSGVLVCWSAIQAAQMRETVRQVMMMRLEATTPKESVPAPVPN